MQSRLSYFAYGSNLHPLRLRRRIGDAPVVSIGTLRGACLRFNKVGLDGSGKCGIQITGDEADEVPGVVYEVTRAQREKLDRFESLGRGYDRVEVTLDTATGTLHAFTYVIMPEYVDDALLPYDWYVNLVRLGALHFGLPDSYVQWLDRHGSVLDPDRDRAAERATLINAIAESDETV